MRAGVAKAKSERPDLILMDIQLPVLDAYETTRQIKADPDLKATPIIAVSSFAMKAMRRRLAHLGAPHAASWKMIPSVWRVPERRRLTPWRMVTR
jgi:CheY-like chemotaxis protein